jgi:hypothetical protein
MDGQKDKSWKEKKEKKQAILLHYPVPAINNCGHI